jgi:hypothetical protein
MTNYSVRTLRRTNCLVLTQLRVPNNDSPTTWPCPTTHYPDNLS